MYVKNIDKIKNCCKKIVFITDERLQLVNKIKKEIATKKTFKKPRKCSIQETLENKKIKVLKMKPAIQILIV